LDTTADSFANTPNSIRTGPDSNTRTSADHVTTALSTTSSCSIGTTFDSNAYNTDTRTVEAEPDDDSASSGDNNNPQLPLLEFNGNDTPSGAFRDSGSDSHLPHTLAFDTIDDDRSNNDVFTDHDDASDFHDDVDNISLGSTTTRATSP
jgi:hypothetical protein